MARHGRSNSEFAIARAEIVIEGHILPHVRVREDQNTSTGHAMPEFPGYNGPAHPALPVIQVHAVTHRRRPIMQTIVGPGEEHVILAGIPTEASILKACADGLPGKVINCHAHSAGGGKLLVILQVKTATAANDTGWARQAALTALATFREVKHVILVDEDVDLFDTDDVLWAMTTRYQGDRDTLFIPGVIGHPLDTSSPDYSHTLNAHEVRPARRSSTARAVRPEGSLRPRAFQPVDVAPFLVPSTRPLDD
ncbi:MAG: UbiD family decarboxylase [Gemmataceae bacterium]